MSNLKKELRSLAELKSLQGLRRLLAEQACIEAFEHLLGEKERRDQAAVKLRGAEKDWDEFWEGHLSNPAWLTILRRRIDMRKGALGERDLDVGLAENALEVSLRNQSQQRECEKDLRTRLKRRARLFHSQRDEKLREAIPHFTVVRK